MQLLYVELQVSPHAVPLQLAVAPASVGQAVQEPPHVATALFDAHVLPHGWYPVLHVNPHKVPSQVAVPFAGAAGHAVHELPHVASAVFDAHVLPHGW
jgi:hypothetical protein